MEPIMEVLKTEEEMKSKRESAVTECRQKLLFAQRSAEAALQRLYHKPAVSVIVG